MMGQNDTTEKEIRQYLVGELSETDMERVESRLFTDQEYFHQLELAESDLADEYVRGVLSGKERQRYENRTLSTREGNEDVRLTVGLRNLAKQKATPSQANRSSEPEKFASPNLPTQKYWSTKIPVKRYAIAAIISAYLIIIVGLSLRVFILQKQVKQNAALLSLATKEMAWQEQFNQQRAEIEQLKETIQIEQTQRQNLEQQLAALKRSDQPANANTSIPNQRSSLASVILTPGSVRGSGERQRVMIRPDLETVKVQLVLRGEPYESYKTVLQDDAGKNILTRSSLKPKLIAGAKRIILNLSAKLLSGGDYVVRLSGLTKQNEFEQIGSYYFQVIK